tara:strand:+ start:263 stop:421 length:159 start_codon:yes stop_codon:yes gene_type:complete
MSRKSREAQPYSYPGKRPVSRGREVFENLYMRGFALDYEVHLPSKHKNRRKK